MASAQVRRKKFKDSLRVVLDCTSAKLSTALRQLGDNATIGDVMRSATSDNNIRDAISQLLFFSAEVVGTDGARQQLRHEQNGAMLMRLECSHGRDECLFTVSYSGCSKFVGFDSGILFSFRLLFLFCAVVSLLIVWTRRTHMNAS